MYCVQVPSRLKEVLKAHIEKAELRLHEQQRRLAHQRRVSRAHDSLMSEDQKKIRKKKLKVRENVCVCWRVCCEHSKLLPCRNR